MGNSCCVEHYVFDPADASQQPPKELTERSQTVSIQSLPVSRALAHPSSRTLKLLALENNYDYNYSYQSWGSFVESEHADALISVPECSADELLECLNCMRTIVIDVMRRLCAILRAGKISMFQSFAQYRGLAGYFDLSAHWNFEKFFLQHLDLSQFPVAAPPPNTPPEDFRLIAYENLLDAASQAPFKIVQPKPAADAIELSVYEIAVTIRSLKRAALGTFHHLDDSVALASGCGLDVVSDALGIFPRVLGILFLHGNVVDPAVFYHNVDILTGVSPPPKKKLQF